MSMVKKLIYLDPEQDRHVKQLARAAGTSDTEIIRRAVEAYWESEAAQIRADTRRVSALVHEYPGGWPDDPADWFKG